MRRRTFVRNMNAARHSLRIALLLLPSLAFLGCNNAPQDLCTRYFEPYPDLVSTRARNPANGTYIDAMTAYKAGDYPTAIKGLEEYLQTPRRDAAPRLYLTCAYLATGDPYKAELYLDHITNSGIKEFNDQVDWYNALCLLCGGQTERAKAQAEWIAGRERHTYKAEAQKLVRDLD